MHSHHQKKRSTDVPLYSSPPVSPGHISSFSTASSLSRQPLPGRANGASSSVTHQHQRDIRRSNDSPPASAYFSSFTGIGNERPPTPAEDARQHFAYSTTLRRHNTLDLGLSGPGPSSTVAAGAGSGAAAMAKLTSLGRIVSHEGKDLFEKVMSGVPGPTNAMGGGAGRLSNETYRMEEGLMMNGIANGSASSSGTANGEKGVEETPSSIFAHLTVEDTASHFATSTNIGLSSSSVPALRDMYGYNEFSVDAPEHVLIKFVKSIFEQPLILLLLGSALVSALMGNYDDAVSITVAILIVLTVGFVQERRSEKSLEALNKLVPHYCHLIRDGQTTHILANELVPGDLVAFSVGDRIPADLRLIDAVDLEIDESSLTGETRPARKGTGPCEARSSRAENPIALAERTCIAYMGTLVRSGHGKGIVIATGEQSEFGVIFSMMQDVKESRTPLQLSMDQLAKKLSVLSFGVIGIICVIGVLQHRDWLEMFTIGVSLAVAAIPEGLPIVTTVTLALGVMRMSRRNAIVKKLPSVEALGSVNVICSDKTGTLTRNEQTVIEVYTVDEVVMVDHNPSTSPAKLNPALGKLLQIGAVCNNARLNEAGVYVGQSTDVALLNILRDFELEDPRRDFTRLSERPFSSEQKYMAVSGSFSSSSFSTSHLHTETDTRERLYMKGSLESVLDRCKFYYVSDEASPALDGNVRSVIVRKATEAASRGLRIVGMAFGFGGVDVLDDEGGQNLVFVGFQCMRDPPRLGVADSIAALQAGGVHVVMITGDAEQTALAIARQLGLRVPASSSASFYGPGAGHGGHRNPGDLAHGSMVGGVEMGAWSGCLTGMAIDRMTPGQLAEVIGNVSVFARTTPRHKMAIVEAFKRRGDVVAMTGDGVNDAPALKSSDIGISMGKSGTDVAKEAASMILVDDNFSTILSAVEEGKSIFYNIQNFLAFQLSTAVAALSLITMSTMFGFGGKDGGGMPLNAMQILFVNILMDGPPSQSLGVDPADPAVMRKPPRRKDEEIISRRVIGRIIFSASVIVFGTLFVYATALSDGVGDERMTARDQTMTFSTFVFLDLTSALQNRGLNTPLTKNRILLSTILISFLVQLTLIYVPMMQRVFQTEALGWTDLVVLCVLSAGSFVMHEARRRYERYLNVRGGGSGSGV